MALPKSTKKKKPRAAPRVQRGAKLVEPNWDGWEEWTGEQIHKHRRATNSWYYEHFKPEDLYTNVYVWMEKENKYTKDQMKWIKGAPKHTISTTAGIVARMDIKGAPRFSQKEADHWESLAGTMGQLSSHIDFLERRIEIAIQEGKESKEEREEELKEKPQKRVISIQERIELQAIAACEKIDTWLEVWSEKDNKFDPKGFDFAKHFVQMKITQAHARKIMGLYEPELKEIKEVLNPPKLKKDATEQEKDFAAQLQEAYEFTTKKELKNMLTALERLYGACQVVIDSSKATRKPRKRKVYSADKLVSKLKFKTTDDKYQLASINPEDIIKCNELWVFNSKTRKIGKYVADIQDPLGQQREGSGLSVKGTTITGFNEKESIQKTLRKPEEQLKEFKNSGKVKLRSFLDDIKAVDIKLNGRINNDIILLKVQ
jgi:hypothetical protein|tara:strand:+ start:4987 stop:6276 length:1290 start_codon:yes stop_codon:yes gene_type:complete